MQIPLDSFSSMMLDLSPLIWTEDNSKKLIVPIMMVTGQGKCSCAVFGLTYQALWRTSLE